MAWNPKGGGGPWGGGGGGGGGPWGGGGGGGGGPWTGGGGPAGPPPNVEEMIRRGQDRLKRMMPGGMGPVRGLVLAAIAVLVVWLGYTVPYRVLPGEQGIELLFGKFVKTTSPGLNFWFPPPIGSYVKLDVEGTRTTDIGFQRRIAGRGRETEADVPLESLMLTGDQNIIDIDFVVQWRISNAADYLFNIERPDITIKRAAESAMREVVGQTPLEEALATKRPQVQAETRILLQQILDDYGAGVAIAEVQLQKVDPPQDVIDAFNDVQRARQDQERSINEANAYRNNLVPRARGEAEKMIQEATAYRERVVKEAEGEAKRFLDVYDSYVTAKDVTTKRLFLERMQDVLKGSEKVIIDQGGGTAGPGVVPYLPLPELRKRASEGATE